MKKHNIFSIILGCSLLPQVFAQPEIVFGKQRDDLYQSFLDGSNLTELVDFNVTERIAGLSRTDSYLYSGFGAFGTTLSISRYDLDGSNPVTLINEGVYEDSLRVTDSYIYYIETIDEKLKRADLNGSNVTELYDITYSFTQALQVSDSAIYWLAENRRIWTSELDGSNPMELLNNSDDRTVGGLAIDDNYFYYTIDGGNTLNRRDLDGTNHTVLLTDATAITESSSLRLAGGRIYWSNAGESIFSASVSGGATTQEMDVSGTIGISNSFPVVLEVVIPEPSSLILLGLGTLAILSFSRHRR